MHLRQEELKGRGEKKNLLSFSLVKLILRNNFPLLSHRIWA